jgi:hypothetical protein
VGFVGSFTNCIAFAELSLAAVCLSGCMLVAQCDKSQGVWGTASTNSTPVGEAVLVWGSAGDGWLGFAFRIHRLVDFRWSGKPGLDA